MKKCSRSVHHSLTELNITPLLDLAFVLLVIFIITTIPPVKESDLKLPTASKHQKDPPRKANYISVQANGHLILNRADLPMSSLLGELLNLRTDDPDLTTLKIPDAAVCGQNNGSRPDIGFRIFVVQRRPAGDAGPVKRHGFVGYSNAARDAQSCAVTDDGSSRASTQGPGI